MHGRRARLGSARRRFDRYRHWRPADPRGALVLLHGVASNSTRWWEFVADTSLKGSWSLIRIDRRGQGGSVWRGATGMREWCDDIAGILDAEGFSRAVVGGHCLGANIAVEFAARHPVCISGLVLIEPLPRDSLIGAMRRTARLKWLLFVLSGMARALNAVGIYRRRLRPLDLEKLDRKTRAAMAAGRTNDSALELYALPLLDLATTPSVSYFRDLLAVTSELPPFSSISAPVLALLSKHSTFTDPPATRRALEAFPDREIVELEARHWIPTEQAAAMREAMEGWIARRFPKP
jgi:pimeloyl-ACP methyl ester carboxylesterase